MEISFQTICKTKKIELGMPNHSFITSGDGTHFFIKHKEIKMSFWQMEDLSPIVESSYCALGVAFIVLKDIVFPDFWTNIQWSARPFFNNGANMFGRNICSSFWGMPVPTYRNLRKYIIPAEYFKTIKKKCADYFKQWEKAAKKIILFPKGVSEFSLDTSEFKEIEKIFTTEKPKKKKKDVVWVNEKFIVVIPKVPHLTGFHFQIFPRLEYWDKKGGFKNPWQLPDDFFSVKTQRQIQGYLEMIVILFGIIKILSCRGNINFYNPEIHFSGNWSKDLLTKENGGEIPSDFCRWLKNKFWVEQNKILKREKKKFLNKYFKKFDTTQHGHLYATFSKHRFVKLPTRPREEVSEEWKNIRPLAPKKVNIIRNLLQAKLTPWLEKNAKSFQLGKTP